MSKQGYFRTVTGEVFWNNSQLTLHRGWWWWDVGCAVMKEGQEQELPIMTPEQLIDEALGLL